MLMCAFSFVLLDEDSQCGLGSVPECWRGPSRCGEDHALCALGMLDW
jgi:hypothetical protein